MIVNIYSSPAEPTAFLALSVDNTNPEMDEETAKVFSDKKIEKEGLVLERTQSYFVIDPENLLKQLEDRGYATYRAKISFNEPLD